MGTLWIGSAPCDENCVQVGEEDYGFRARIECNRFIGLIQEKLGKEPDGARLFVKTSHHDFGDYLEVCVRYDESKPAAIDYAFMVESEAPTTWEG